MKPGILNLKSLNKSTRNSVHDRIGIEACASFYLIFVDGGIGDSFLMETCIGPYGSPKTLHKGYWL